MANPHITESETQRAPKALKSSKEDGSDGVFPKGIAKTLSRIFSLSLQTSQIPDDWHHAIVPIVAQTSRTADSNLSRPDFCCLRSARSYSQREDAWPFVPILIIDVAKAWLPSPMVNPDQTPRGRRIDYKMARRRKCSRPDFSEALDLVN